MKKNIFFLFVALLIALGGFAQTQVASADDPVTPAYNALLNQMRAFKAMCAANPGNKTCADVLGASVQITGTGSYSNTPSDSALGILAGRAVMAIPAGETRPKGALVEIRKVDNDAKTIDVIYGFLDQDTTFGPRGMVSVDGWDGYGSMSEVASNACREAMARKSETSYKNAWDAGYTVTLMGSAVPSVCVQ